jgi:putative membrane-bound dehydrogenase-like protein
VRQSKLFVLLHLVLAGTAGAQGAPPRAAEGFTIEKVAGDEVQFPMFGAFDDRGRLYVTESSGGDLYVELKNLARTCKIRVLEDADGDGRFEKSHVFAEGLTPSMGLAWRDGKLYAADPPDLVTFEDTDGDGKADKRTVVLTGFGHTDNGSLHGLIFGPDGYLYMTMGTPDGYTLARRDGSTLTGRSGALLRCRPDGTDPEVLSRGFCNLVEVDFTGNGEVFGTVNWFQLPVGGIRDAIVHLVDGGLYPYEKDSGTPQPVTGDPLPPVSRFPAVALSGVVTYRGPTFPAEMRGNLFTAQHNSRTVGRHVLYAEGATYRSHNLEFVTSADPDFHPSDVLEDADGSLIVIDTGGWYIHHCPSGQLSGRPMRGGLYRVRAANAKPVLDPRGLGIDWAKRSTLDLVGLLADPRPVVKDRARAELVRRGEAVVPALLEAGTDPALWAISQIPGDVSRSALRSALKRKSAVAARALALRADRGAAPDLAALLGSPNLGRAAAEALSRCGGPEHLGAVWKALAADALDRFAEHALILAAHRLADAEALRRALDHPHPRVQKAALLLLAQPPRPPGSLAPEAVVSRVASADADLRQTALKLIQQGAAPAGYAVGLVRKWAGKETLSAEEKEGLRGTVVAFQTHPPMHLASGEGLRRGSEEVRLLLLETLARTSLKFLPEPWSEGLAKALEDRSAAVRLQGVKTVGVLRAGGFDAALARLSESAAESSELRLEALRALVPRRPKLTPEAVEFLTGQLDGKASPVARLAAAEILRRAHLTDVQLTRALKAVREDTLVAPGSLVPSLRESTGPEAGAGLLEELTESLRRGWRPTEAELENVLARLPAEVREKSGRRVRELLKQAPEEVRAKLAEYEPLARGGDVAKGRAVFFGAIAACSTCHRMGDLGGHVGPDLTKIGAVRSARDLLESILVPSSTFAQGYESYKVATEDGNVLSGLIARQSADAVVLKDASAAEVQVRRDQIRRMERAAVSIMPEGLERKLTREEFRDLLAFLQAQK